MFFLRKEEAESLVNAHFAFGDPLEDEYALGNYWATGDNAEGWRIVERKISVPVIKVHIKISEDGGTSHVTWRCPSCKQPYSDDWEANDELPTLLACGCETTSKYLLGVS